MVLTYIHQMWYIIGEDREVKNMMTTNQIIEQINRLNEWEALLEDVKAQAEAIRDTLKAECEERDTEELVAGGYVIRWTSVLSNRFDSTSFKREYKEVYNHYVKQVYSRRFSISC